MDGIPLVYNGMEIGDTGESGGPALTERVPVFWPIVERRPEFEKFYRSMIALRRDHPALRRGDTLWVNSSAPDRVVSFVRRAPGEDVLVSVNLSSQPWTGSVDAPAGAPFVEITPAVPLPQQPGGASPGRTAHAVELPSLALDAWGFRLFRRVSP
jgi:glycosidase